MGGAPLGERGPAERREPFDCVAFFNPTSFDEYDATVNGWADALLVMINTTVQAYAPAVGGQLDAERLLIAS